MSNAVSRSGGRLTSRLSRWLGTIFTPLQSMAASQASQASDLRVIRELYELQMASLTDALGNAAPIIRVTEKPGKDDTLVSYMSDGDLTEAQELAEQWARDSEEDE